MSKLRSLLKDAIVILVLLLILSLIGVGALVLIGDGHGPRNEVPVDRERTSSNTSAAWRGDGPSGSAKTSGNYANVVSGGFAAIRPARYAPSI